MDTTVQNIEVSPEISSSINQQSERVETLEEYIERHQTYWKNIVEGLSKKLSKLPDLIELESSVIVERQYCLEYYYNLLNKISKISKEYKVNYAKQFNYYKTGSNIRYGSDNSINAQIAADLSDYTYKIELLNGLAKYMQETLRNLDTVSYSIKNRIEIEKLVQSYGK